MNHVSVSPTNGNGPTQGQRKSGDLVIGLVESGIWNLVIGHRAPVSPAGISLPRKTFLKITRSVKNARSRSRFGECSF